jgi:hypothetical protein
MVEVLREAIAIDKRINAFGEVTISSFTIFN